MIVEALNASTSPWSSRRIRARGRDRRRPRLGRVRLVEPLGYLDFAALASQARVIVTDSGGLQKEAYWYGVPCVTARPSPSGSTPSSSARTSSWTTTRPPRRDRRGTRPEAARRSTGTARRLYGDAAMRPM